MIEVRSSLTPTPQVRCTYVVGEEEADREKQRGEKKQTHRKRGGYLLASLEFLEVLICTPPLDLDYVSQ